MQSNIYKKIHDALAWRIRELLGDALVDRTLVKAARAWRPFVDKPVYIGISGSAGKTTTKELLVCMLSLAARGSGNPSTLNVLPEVAKTILRVRPTHDFCVAELSEHMPGSMDAPLALFKPSIGIVTVMGDDHSTAFNSQEGLAEEVGKLIASLPAKGTAVLNADDERVLAMAKKCRGNVITYGTSPEAALRADKILSVWPDRLEFTVTYGEEEVKVLTQLCGVHWVPTVLSAMGGGLAMGLSLADCVEGIGEFAPYDGRMQPVYTTPGVTFIRDDFKAPLWTVDASFAFMKEAKVARKIIVVGSLSECGARSSKKYLDVAIKAQAIADHTIFVGTWAFSALKATKLEGKAPIRAFRHVKDATRYLDSLIQHGDLILLKATNTQEHLSRMILSRESSVACWRDDCARLIFCSECSLLNTPSGTGHTDAVKFISASSDTYSSLTYPHLNADEQIVIGLGNPEERYVGTPHNIGYEVVNLLAEELHLDWVETPDAWFAHGMQINKGICLLKVKQSMNLIGGGLKQLAKSMHFSPEQCIIVFDDLALPLGVVRGRMNGGAGGHRGVASILEIFQTNNFRRVKIGVGQSVEKSDVAEYMLRPFKETTRTVVAQSVEDAKARVLEMVERHKLGQK